MGFEIHGFLPNFLQVVVHHHLELFLPQIHIIELLLIRTAQILLVVYNFSSSHERSLSSHFSIATLVLTMDTLLSIRVTTYSQQI